MKPRGQYGFRLETEMAKLLEKEASKRGLTPGRYARLLVIDALVADSDTKDLVREELRLLRDEVQTLKENLQTATVALLQTAAALPEDEVTKWAEENLS